MQGEGRTLTADTWSSVLARCEVFQLTVNVGGLPEKRVFEGELEYFEEDIESVDAVIVFMGGAGALRLRPNGCFVLVI